jgi:hypothetical protein
MFSKMLPGLVFLAIIIVEAGVPRAWAQTAQPPSASPTIGTSLTSDFKYLANNFELDAEDIVTSPLHIGAVPEMLTRTRFYLALGGTGALFGGSFAMDQTMRSHLRSMSSGTADTLQNVSYAGVSTATVALYGYGLYVGDSRARQCALTAGEGAGIATLLDLCIKAAFGRLRPSQSPSHTAFFHGGQSFVSGDVTPMFALAAGVSEYYDNRWYVALPVYSLALADGFGRMVMTRIGFRTSSAARCSAWALPNSSCISIASTKSIRGASGCFRWRRRDRFSPKGAVSPPRV